MSGSLFARFHLPRLDPRAPEQIAADLDDEFAFHLDEIERELVETGHAPTDARAAARQRFGEVDRIKKQCMRLALGERIMLQRLNSVLMVTVLIAVGLVSVQLFFLTNQLKRTIPIPVEMVAAPVLIDGDVARPAYYALGDDGGEVTLLHELLAEVGGISANQRVSLIRRGLDGSDSSSSWPAAKLMGERPQKIVLLPGDSVRVTTLPDEYESRRRTAGIFAPPVDLVGQWSLSGDNGVLVDETVTLDIASPDDIMNMTGSPTGTLHLPALDAEIRLIFRYQGSHPASSNLEIHDRVGQPGYKEYGRWKLEEDRLTLNVTRAGPDVDELKMPLVFIRADA